MKTVTEVSKLTGVSVRTLHHYDTIGLLKPTAVTENIDAVGGPGTGEFAKQAIDIYYGR